MMRKAFYVLLLGASLFTAKAEAQASKISFVEYDLPNGLHVILHEDHSTPIVAVSVMYHVGSKNEDPERTGFAHFFDYRIQRQPDRCISIVDDRNTTRPLGNKHSPVGSELHFPRRVQMFGVVGYRAIAIAVIIIQPFITGREANCH